MSPIFKYAPNLRGVVRPVRPAPRPRPVFVAVVLVAVLTGPTLFAGCLGIERTEWAFTTTQITTLEDEGYTGSGVTIAVIDTGLDISHPSLDHVDVVAWRDYLNGRDKPYDDTGHGTHVAGIIASKGGSKEFLSGASVKGVAPDVSLIVAKVCSQEECDGDAVVQAISWSVAQGADIITLSLGGRQAIISLGANAEDAAQGAANKGVYVVAAAGNQGTDHGDVESPASAQLAIAVGAVDADLRVPQFSSRGSESSNSGSRLPTGQSVGGREDPHKKPELVAPGVDILSAWQDGQYARATGTSQAAPFVAGTLALLLEAHPEWKRTGSKGGDGDAVTTMKSVLTKSAKPIPGQRTPHDNAAGYGLLQAASALERLSVA